MATEVLSQAPSCDQVLKPNLQETFELGIPNPPYQEGSIDVAELAKGLAGSAKDSDSEDDEASPRPQHITERRRAQNAIFSSWYGHTF